MGLTAERHRHSALSSVVCLESVARPDTWLALNRVLRHVSSLGLACVTAGALVGGVGGRIVMSVSAAAAGPDLAGRLTENGNRIGDFTVGGTIALIVFGGIFSGLIASVPVVGSYPWWEWARALKGLGYGLVSLALVGYTLFDSVDFRILEPVGLNVSMFLGLVMVFGFAVVGIKWLYDRWLPEPRGEGQYVYLVLVAAGAPIPLMMGTLFYTSSSFCGCVPAYGIGAAAFVMIVSTGVYLASQVTDRIPTWASRVAPFTGYGALLLGLILGLRRLIEGLTRLIG